MPYSFRILTAISLLSIGKLAYCVPYNFLKSDAGNMRDLQWSLLQSNNVQVYCDIKALPMGRYAIRSVQEAYPYLSRLLGVQIGIPSPLPPLFSDEIKSKYDNIVLVLGDRTEGPGFANPVTQNIEAQMIHPRGASFFQHELVHRLMYEHNDFHIGAPGRLFSLAMMPTWWIEGLAEYMTESVGPVETSSIERSMARNDYWPTWETLHALYNADGDTNLRGYVTAGRFLGWIFSHTKEKNLYAIHEEIAHKTIVPFFYSAVDQWIANQFQTSGKELYEQFKKDRKEYWSQQFPDLPSLKNASTQQDIFQEDFPFPVENNGNRFLLSKIVSKYSPLSSSIELAQTKNKENQLLREPLSLTGSSLLAAQDNQNSYFITSNRIRFSNGTKGDGLKIIYFKGDLFQINSQSILEQIEFPFATKETPYVIEEIEQVGQNEFLIHASLRGNSFVFSFQAQDKKLTKITEYSFPTAPHFIGAAEDHCTVAIVDYDKDQTSLEKICVNKSVVEIFSKGQLNILDGYKFAENKFRLLISQNEYLSLVDLQGKEIQFVARFPDLIKGLRPIEKNAGAFSGWIYENGKYHFYVFDTKKIKENYDAWDENHVDKSLLKKENLSPQYTPPFQKYYEAAFHELNPGSIKNQEEFPQPDISQSPIKQVPADYHPSFQFFIPYGLPSVFGGPSVNLVAIPYQDQIERDTVYLSAGYNFYLKAPTGSVSYVNNRILDGFGVTLFSSPFFNGIYSLANGNSYTNYYNYLLQYGLNVATGFKFRPSSFFLQQNLTFSQIQPYTTLKTAPTGLGPQKTSLVSLKEDLQWNISTKSFDLSAKNKPKSQELFWTTDMAIGGSKSYGLSAGQDSAGNTTQRLNYYNAAAKIASSFSIKKHLLTLNSRLSTTQGPHTFYLREYYSPFSEFILGETDSLSSVAVPLISQGSLYNIALGTWSREISLTYQFPLFPNYETLLMMAYLNNLRGMIGLNAGGVSLSDTPSRFNNIYSAKLGLTATIDIKGFQIYPSFYFAKLLNSSGWGVITQFKFMQFM